MILKQTSAPATEPITITEAKLQCRVEISDDDDLFNNIIIPGARQYIEDAARRAFITQTWRLSLDKWPDCNYIQLPKPPLISVTSVTYTDNAGSATVLSSALYGVDTDSEPGRVVLNYGEVWPSNTLRTMNPIQIVYVAGYGAASAVPARFKQAILLLVGHWYENREGVMLGTISKEIELAVESLIWVDRVF